MLEEVAFCITPMLTALKRPFCGSFWSVLEHFDLSFFFGGGGDFFSIFLYFLRNVWYVLMKFCKDILGITLANTKNNVACCLYFAKLFKVILGPIFAHYTVLLVLNPKYSPDVLYRLSGH